MTSIFKERFKPYVCMGDTITAELDGFTIKATLYQDDNQESPEARQDGFWPSHDPKAVGYLGEVSKRTFERHMAHSKEVIRQWERGDWSYCGVAVTVSRNDVELTGKYSHAVWGCDYNYPVYNKRHYKGRHDYLMEYAEDLASEALKEAKAKLAALVAQ